MDAYLRYAEVESVGLGRRVEGSEDVLSVNHGENFAFTSAIGTSGSEMTRDRAFKERVRERMAKTGESYTAARRQLLQGKPARATLPGSGVHHASAAARELLRHHGHDVPEASLFVAGGGVGIGVFSFNYPEFSSFYLAGRHLWHDDLLYLEGLAGRLGTELKVRESTSAKKARSDLEEALLDGPVAAFVDLASLGHRAGLEAYYLVVVHELDLSRDTARVSDLAEEPVEVPLAALAAARSRHRKFKNRLLQFRKVPSQFDLARAMMEGIRACVEGFSNPAFKGFSRNFTLEALDKLAKSMRGTGKESWASTFPRGPRLWTALSSFYEYVEHYGTGGGLLRPFLAQGMTADEIAGEPGMVSASKSYGELGEMWSEAARAALPYRIAEFAELRRLVDESYETYYSLGGKAGERLETLARQRHELTHARFPLGEQETAEHLDRLAEHIEGLAQAERRTLSALAAA